MAKSKVRWNKKAVAKAAKHPRRRSKVEVFKDSRGHWRFRIVAGNGEVIAQSEGYTRRYTAKLGAKRVLAAS